MTIQIYKIILIYTTCLLIFLFISLSDKIYIYYETYDKKTNELYGSEDNDVWFGYLAWIVLYLWCDNNPPFILKLIYGSIIINPFYYINL
jgi:hypothetical protein